VTFWFWIGDKIAMNRCGIVIRGLNMETVYLALVNPYEEYVVFDYDILEVRDENPRVS